MSERWHGPLTNGEPNKHEALLAERAWWQKFMLQQKAKSTYPERLMGPATTNMIVDGKNDQDAYESFVIRKMEHSESDSLWICFPGINTAESGANRPAPVISGFPAGVPGTLDLTPHEGTSFVFHGPTAIAGYTPEQCIHATENVLRAVEQIVATHPGKQIRIFGFSAGTHLAVYIANQLGMKSGKAINKLILVSPGESIAKGIYKTPVTEPLAEDLYSRGITMQEYDRKILAYTQRMNLDYLPAGRNLVVHAATRDTFISKEAEGGTDDIVQHMKEKGKEPTYVVHKGVDHITLPLSIILQQMRGADPYRLIEPRSVWENERAFRDEKLLRTVETKILSAFSESELRLMGNVLADKMRGSKLPFKVLTMQEKALAYALIEHGTCTTRETPVRGSAVMGFEVNEQPSVPSMLERHRQHKEGLATIERFNKLLLELDHDPTLTAYEAAPHEDVTILDELRKLSLPIDQYAVLEDSLSQKVGKGIQLVVSAQLYEDLKRRGWREQKSDVPHMKRLQHGNFTARDYIFLSGIDTAGFETVRSAIELFDTFPIFDRARLATLGKLKQTAA